MYLEQMPPEGDVVVLRHNHCSCTGQQVLEPACPGVAGHVQQVLVAAGLSLGHVVLVVLLPRQQGNVQLIIPVAQQLPCQLLKQGQVWHAGQFPAHHPCGTAAALSATRSRKVRSGMQDTF